MLDGQKMQKLKELLESEHSWPGPYLFKFIVPAENGDFLIAMFRRGEIKKRYSRSGKYLSLSVTMHMSGAEEVISVYKSAAKIPGLISL